VPSHKTGRSDVSAMLKSPWPEGCKQSAGSSWALVLMGETVTKECHSQACCCDCLAHGTDNDDSSPNALCYRKNLCVPHNWQFKHATRILEVTMLQHPLKVHPMPGNWVQSVPVTAIPWESMNTVQRNTFERSIRES